MAEGVNINWEPNYSPASDPTSPLFTPQQGFNAAGDFNIGQADPASDPSSMFFQPNASIPSAGFDFSKLGQLPQPVNTPPPAPPGLGAHGFQGAGGLLDYYDRFNQLRV
jgi:hypothetical protein